MKKNVKKALILFCLTIGFIGAFGLISDHFNKSEEAVEVVSEKVLVPGGQSVGIRMNVKGVLVVGLEEIETENSVVSPGYDAGLQIGDIILSVNGQEVYYADEEPAILCFNYFSRAVFAEIPSWEEFENTSAFFLLRERAGRVMMRDRIEMEAKEISELLPLTDQVKHFNCKALLQFDTINYDQNNQPAMYGLCYYNTNFIRFNLLRNQNIY